MLAISYIFKYLMKRSEWMTEYEEQLREMGIYVGGFFILGIIIIFIMAWRWRYLWGFILVGIGFGMFQLGDSANSQHQQVCQGYLVFTLIFWLILFISSKSADSREQNERAQALHQRTVTAKLCAWCGREMPNAGQVVGECSYWNCHLGPFCSSKCHHDHYDRSHYE